MDGEIDPDELAALLGEEGSESDDGDDGDGGDSATDDLRVVDIRDQRAFDRGHIPGSDCIPFPELTTRVAELEGAARIVTVCPHGVASRQAAQLIGSYAGTQDARVESLRGGIEAWERGAGELVPTAADDAANAFESGDPTESGNSAETAEEGPEAPF